MGVRVGVSTSLGQSDRSTSGALVASELLAGNVEATTDE